MGMASQITSLTIVYSNVYSGDNFGIRKALIGPIYTSFYVTLKSVWLLFWNSSYIKKATILQ